jgi:hypothetical protein
MEDVELKDGLWFIGSRLVIPDYGNIREKLLRLAHESTA